MSSGADVFLYLGPRWLLTTVQEFENLNNEAKVQQLHKLLRPYFLRRIKQDVMPTLPPKAEILVPLSLTSLQKEYLLLRNGYICL